METCISTGSTKIQYKYKINTTGKFGNTQNKYKINTKKTTKYIQSKYIINVKSIQTECRTNAK